MEKKTRRDEGKPHIGSDETRYGGLRQMVKAASLFFGLGFFLAANVGVCIFLGFPVAILSLWKKMSGKN